MAEIIVLGAGIVGVCVAIHLQRRGRSVVLLDRREPGRETSFGNAGVIQAEGVNPHAFPRDLGMLFGVALNRRLDARYDPVALPGYAANLVRYWWHSAPERYQRMVAEYAPLIAHALPEHAELIVAAEAGHLIEKKGWLWVFRTDKARDKAIADAARNAAAHGVGYRALDGGALAELEPDLLVRTAGGVHWTDPWTVRDPGALTDAYVALFRKLGGTVGIGDARTLTEVGAGWTVTARDGAVTAPEIVLALGPWAREATRALGYRLPLFVKRGYHMHYRAAAGATLNRPALDAERGYLLAPMAAGIRLTTGTEFAALDAPANTRQIDGAEPIARSFFPLRERVDNAPWLGARPCTPDMKPIIGPAPGHKGLWFAIGHAHHGLTLGAVTGRLLAERMLGETPFLNLAPFAAERFHGGKPG